MSELTRNHKKTEEDIKLQSITPAIVNAGWNPNTQIMMEYRFTDGRIVVQGDTTSRKKQKAVDYLLCYQSNMPLAVVEAKDNNHSLGDGMQQAMDYGEALDVPFVYSSNGNGFLEHDMIAHTETELRLDEFPSPKELWKRYKDYKDVTKDQEDLITRPYYFKPGDKTPRYYQRVAINRTIEAIAKGQDRILLVMATGTGKTYTAFQIIYRLWESGQKKKVLYLADRNILIDQTMAQDFAPFSKVMTKIEGKNLDSSYEIYLSLYHQLAGEEGDEPFREFKPEFFDLILIDECHRGSAKEESKWRKILEYFSSATQIGMTATPKETSEVSNTSYFGEPIYTYSLKQGIDDGFLAPYKVLRVGIDVDLEGWRPADGMRDVDGYKIEDREYDISDYDKSLVIDDRTKLVAERISNFLRESNDRYAKTIVFCVDIDHAERMRQALVNENSDMLKESKNYVMKITGDDAIGKAQLDNFIAADSKFPVIVTTSKLLTTGVDCKTCKVIVLDTVINSVTEFKQIIGRGTRLCPDYGKEYFTIIDFRGATKLFADPDFDGDPFREDEDDPIVIIDPVSPPVKPPVSPPNPNPKPIVEPRHKFRVRGVEVEILNERVQYYDEHGKLTTTSFIDFTKNNILEEYASLDEFLNAWKAEDRKQAIIEGLKEHGVLLEQLREAVGLPEIDDFDLICHIAYDKKPLTRTQRANKVRSSDYLNKYEGTARKVLEALLDKYMDNGSQEIYKLDILKIEPFRQFGSPVNIAKLFGGKEKYLEAVYGLQNEIYAIAA